MTPLQFIFLVTAAVTLLAAIQVVTRHNLVHAALFLIVSLFGVAVFFVLLEAGFLAVVQVIVYIGAIAILLIFGVMLTRRLTDESVPAANIGYGWAAVIAGILLFSLVAMLSLWPSFNTEAPRLPSADDTIIELGKALVSPNAYLIPFEVASVLLLAALVGGIYISWLRRGEK